MTYLLVIAAAWLINGSLKFAVNYWRNPAHARSLIGYGGFPSTHSAVVASLLGYTGFAHSFDHPAIAALLALLWVVANDATSLRKRIENHAKHLNRLDSNSATPHRERIAHKWYEIAGGIAVGIATGWAVWKLLPLKFLTAIF